MSLDSSSFPHILDRIVDMVKAADDHPTLVNLRATCKSLDNQLTPLVMNHATLKTTRTGYTIKTVHGAPGITSWWPPLGGSASIFLLREAEVNGLLAFIQNADVLDLETPVTFQADIVFDLYLPTIKVLRHKASSHIDGPQPRHRLAACPNSILADKEVFFINLTRQRDLASNWMYFEASETTKEVVLTYTYDPSLDFRIDDHLHTSNPPPHPRLICTQEHLVLIFKPVANAKSHRFPPSGNGTFAAFEAVMSFIVHNTTDTRRFTIVGFGELDWRWVGIPHECEGEDLVKHFRDAYRFLVYDKEDRRGNSAASRYAARLASLLNFVSLEEYKQQVGEYEFKINTEE